MKTKHRGNFFPDPKVTSLLFLDCWLCLSKKQSTDRLSGVSACSTRSTLLQITGLEPVRENLPPVPESSEKLLAVLLFVPAGVEPAAILCKPPFPLKERTRLENKALSGVLIPANSLERQIFVRSLLAVLLCVCAEVESAAYQKSAYPSDSLNMS